MEKKKKNKFHIVAFGASAGGLEAVIEIMKHLSPTTGMAFIYVQHLDPSHKSMLAPILANVTKMKVVEAVNRMKISPDTVYIIPHNQDILVNRDRIIVSNREIIDKHHMPVDRLFISLAAQQKEEAIAVLLSGTGHDGTYGLKAIKQHGGITIAQDDTAKFTGMPQSAIAEGVVDLAIPPQEIAKELERLSKQIVLIKKTPVRYPADTGEHREVDLTIIIKLLKEKTGADFTHYKMSTIRRRIIRRMLLHNYNNLQQYNQHLRQHDEEINALYHDLLINVTNFFRESDTMEYLKKRLFPKILKNKTANDAIRVWITACSTGEEAYSIAILLTELLSGKSSPVTVQVFATDLSELAITKARRGVYSRNELINISKKRLQRFFVKGDGEYRVTKAIRDICVFAPQNVFRDPPFSRMDFISCCNLMIYLEPVLQKKILATFHYALKNNGYLMIGKSETVGNSARLFTQVDKKHKIYQKKKDVAPEAMIEMNYNVPNTVIPGTTKIKKTDSKAMQPPSSELEKTINEILLKRYVPATVVVNADLEILQFRGSTGLFLEPSAGKASLNLLKMARPGLEFELRNTIHKASKSREPIKKTGIEIKIQEVTYDVSIEVTPLKIENDERLFLIIFEETPLLSSAVAKAPPPKDKVINQLQEELRMMREDMRTILEEKEGSHEELQTANEEILSNNEELQSINEELETSKEEIESANEELLTINTELQTRNEQLSEAYGYSEAVIAIISEAVLVLDKNLKVKTANDSFYKIFRAKADNTEGKLVYDLNNGQWNIPELKKLLENTLKQTNQVSGYVVEHDFPGIGKKIMILNARKLVQKSQKDQLILLAVEDITEHRMAEKIVAEREAWFRNMADNVPVMIWVTDKDNKGTFFNKTWLDYTGRRSGAGNMLSQDIHPDDVKEFIRVCRISSKEQKPFTHEGRIRRYDGQYRWILTSGKPTYSTEGIFTGFIGTSVEIHDQLLINKELEERVNERTNQLTILNNDLQQSNKDLQQFAYAASHDLQEPLHNIISFTNKLQRDKQKYSGETNSYLEKINSASVNMTQLIDDLLNFSRITNTNQKFAKINLGKIIKGVLPEFKDAIKEKKARIKIGSLPVIDAFGIQMEQLFRNLVSNALNFSKKGIAPVIKIESHPLPARLLPVEFKNNNGDYIEITCSDNGIGFGHKSAEQVFTIFQRLNDREDYPGTGIGLALCRKIVNNHGGKIYAQSTRNKGATFHIILPVKHVSPGSTHKKQISGTVTQ